MYQFRSLQDDLLDSSAWQRILSNDTFDDDNFNATYDSDDDDDFGVFDDDFIGVPSEGTEINYCSKKEKVGVGVYGRNAGFFYQPDCIPPPALGYTCLVIFGTAAAASAIVTIALVIPLFLQCKNKGPNKKMAEKKRTQSKRVRIGEVSYSTYNLYLVYISITDLFLSLTRVSWAVRALLQKEYYDNMAGVYLSPYFTANFSINAIVCYQIWALLQSTKQGKRIDPPSLTRVNLQSCLGYFLAVIIGGVTYFFPNVPINVWSSVFVLLSIYIFGVSGLVWYRGYLKRNGAASVNDKGTRVLALFFFRIVWIFTLFFIPGALLWFLVNFLSLKNTGDSDSSWTDSPWTDLIFYIFFGLQPIATACCVLTKPDCRKYIVDFVTLSYCCGFGGKESPETAGRRTTSQTIRGFSMASFITIRGFSMKSFKTFKSSIRNRSSANDSPTERKKDSLKENNNEKNPGEGSTLKRNDISAWDATSTKQRMLSMEDDTIDDDEENNNLTEDGAVTSAEADTKAGACIYYSKQAQQNQMLTVSTAGETISLR